MANHSEADLDYLFSLLRPVPGAHGYAYDHESRIVCRSEHGKLTNYGWHVDHIIPESIGGFSHLSNYRARHWLGNTSAGGTLGGLLSNYSGGVR